MASIVANNNYLYLSFYQNGTRYRKPLGLKNTQKNKEKAERDLPDLILAIQTGKVSLNTIKSEKTFEYYTLIFLKTKQKELKESTYYKYNLLSQKFIAKFGKKEVKSIKVSEIKNYINSLEVSPKSIREYLIVMKGIFDEAFYDEEIKDNPIKYIKKPKLNRVEINPLFKDEVNLILDNTSGQFHNFLGIAFYTGMRTGELLALKWENIDFVRNEIDIKLTRSEHGETMPKTDGSYRTIPMFDKVKTFLENQKIKTYFKDYVFLNQYDKPYVNSHTLANHYWKPLLKRLGLKNRRLYETRHTFATMMLEYSDFTPLEIANMLGHSTSQMIFTKYSKFVQNKGRKINLNYDVFSHNIDIQKNKVAGMPIE